MARAKQRTTGVTRRPERSERNVSILGASGQVARWVIGMLADAKDLQMTLFLRDRRKLQVQFPATRDVLDDKKLATAVTGQDIVYANLAGEDIDRQAKHVVASMGRHA